jgi:hypothetical protein
MFNPSEPHDLILRPTTFGPSGSHFDRPGLSYAIVALGETNYKVLWTPAGFGQREAEPGDVVFADLSRAAPGRCPHCGKEADCAVLDEARRLHDWLIFKP